LTKWRCRIAELYRFSASDFLSFGRIFTVIFDSDQARSASRTSWHNNLEQAEPDGAEIRVENIVDSSPLRWRIANALTAGRSRAAQKRGIGKLLVSSWIRKTRPDHL
jgi:hypothetical protein